MQECDTLLIVWLEPALHGVPAGPGQARGVQIDIDARRLGHRHATEVNLVGDSARTLRAPPLLEPKDAHSWRDRIAEWNEQWWRVVEARAMDEAEPLNGQRVFWELSERLPDNAIITS